MNQPTRFLARHSLRFAVSFGMALLALAPAASRAQTVSPVPAPTIITTAPYTISTPGYYQLGANLVLNATTGSIITVNASNVTLDFAGHYISGPTDVSSQLNGVLITERGNVNVQNGTIAFCYRGINFSGTGSSNSLEINEAVRNMLVTRCFYEAIRLQSCSGSTVQDCQVTFTGGSTVITNSTLAVYSSGGLGGNRILDTSVSSTSNTAASGIAYAIYADSKGAKVINCTVDTATATGSGGTAYGIYSPDIALGNIISSCQTGISGATKYKDNLTVNCTTPFDGGAAVGFNN